ncbi:MAG TPA: CopG family transcriptional regulator [Burkholderiales bacterium]|nr:CopG family transcriptional regulator [Burkholderiales bacterium]
MKNVTITLDEETAAWARVHAARRNVSLSRYVGELLRQHMRESREYEEAMRRFLDRKPVKLKHSGERYPTREELYDRPGLRRR